MDLTNNIDLLDDEEEEKKPLIDAQPAKPAVPPSLSHVFSNRDELETAVDTFVPKSLYNDARDRASKADELLASNKKQMSPLFDEMSKFRDELDNVSNDVPAEGRMPFWEGQKIEDPDMFIDEINNQFNIAENSINELNNNFSEQTSTGLLKLLTTYDNIQKAVVLLKVDMLQILNINVDYVDADGD